MRSATKGLGQLNLAILWFSFVLMLGLAVSLAACGQATPSAASTTTTIAATTTTATTSVAVTTTTTTTPAALPTVTPQPSPTTNATSTTTAVTNQVATATPTTVAAVTVTAASTTAALTAVTANATPSVTAAQTAVTTGTGSTPSPTVSATGQLAYLDNGNLNIYNSSDQTKKLIYQATGTSGLTGTPAWSPDNSQMAIVLQLDTKNPNSPTNLYLLKLNGSAPQRVSNGNAANCEENPIWSHSGDMLAFVVVVANANSRQCTSTDPREIWVANANGQNPHKIANGLQPVWSADGKSLLYVTNGSLSSDGHLRQNNAIHLISLADSKDKEVISTKNIPSDLTAFGYPFQFDPKTSFLQYPALLNNGSIVAFTTQGASALVGTVNADGSNFKLWSGNPEGGFGQTYVNPAKDNLLAYQSYPPSGIPDIAIIDVNSQPLPMRVTTIQIGGAQIKETAISPAWSPDGQMLAYLYLTGDYPPTSGSNNTGLAIVTINGGKAVNPQTVAKGGITSVAWSH